MRTLKGLVSVLLVSLWMPAVCHCLLEQLGVLGDEGCCPTTEARVPAGSHNCEDNCQSFEELGFTLQDQHATLLPPSFSLLIAVLIPDATSAPPGVGETLLPDQRSISLPQFIARTLHPVRAPSAI